VIETPLYMQTKTYTARQDRFLADLLLTEGVTDRAAGAVRVSPRASGANLSVDVAAGDAVVDGDDFALQGAYTVRVTASENVAIPAPPSTGARIDLVVLRVYDSTSAGGDPALDGARLEVVEGVAATTPNAPAAPKTAILLAEVRVAAGVTSIVDADITDRRAAVIMADPNQAYVAKAGGDTITASAATVVPLTLKAAESQTADFMHLRGSDNSVLLSVSPAAQINTDRVGTNGLRGRSGVADRINLASTTISTILRNDIGTTGINVVVEAVASQSGDMAQFRNSAGTVLTNVRAGGDLTAPTVSAGSFHGSGSIMLFARPATASHRGLVVKATAAQTGDTVQVLNDAGSPIAKIDATGQGAFTTTAGLRTLEVGAVDSAGVGFRTVRVAN
jgi:hypothetical protein